MAKVEASCIRLEFSIRPNVWILMLFGNARAIKNHGSFDIIASQVMLYLSGAHRAIHDGATEFGMVQPNQMPNLMKRHALKIHGVLIICRSHVNGLMFLDVQVKSSILRWKRES